MTSRINHGVRSGIVHAACDELIMHTFDWHHDDVATPRPVVFLLYVLPRCVLLLLHRHPVLTILSVFRFVFKLSFMYMYVCFFCVTDFTTCFHNVFTGLPISMDSPNG